MSDLARDVIHGALIEYLHNQSANVFIAGQTYIPVSGKVIDAQDYRFLLDAVLDGNFTEGRFTREFSRRLAMFVGVRHALLVNSGSSANLVALTTLMQTELGEKQLRPGDKFITTATGFPTTISPAVQAGLIPVFVDVDFPTYTPSLDKIEEAITEGVKAIVLAHPLGNPFELQKMRDLADEYGIFLVGDCCDALGSEINGAKVGTVEDIATLSFYPAHHITTGEGGAVLTNSSTLNKFATSISQWGRSCWCEPGKDNTCGKRFGWKCGELPPGYDHKYIYQRLGYNLKITDLQSALGVGQMAKLQNFIDRRQYNWQRLYNGLSDLDGFFILPKATTNSSPSWFGFALTLQKSCPFTRNDIVRHLEDSGIGTRLFFGGNLLRQPAFLNIPHMISGNLYNSNVIMRDTFWIGVWPGITDEMLDYMLDTLHSFVRSKK